MKSSSSAYSVAPTSCQRALGLLETFVDGELTPEQTLGVESHLGGCPSCQAHADFLQSVSNSVNHAVHDEAQISEGFLARLNRAVDAEVVREIGNQKREVSRPFPWQTRAGAVALAASAAAWFTFRLTTANNAQTAAGTPSTTQAALTGAPVEDILTIEGALDRLIDVHSSPPKPQITTADLVPAMEPEVGVHIQLPRLEQYGARWEGASVIPVRNQHAASFRYQLPNHRVTLYVFNSSKLRVRHPDQQPDRALTAPIYVGQWRGYTVAAKENRGIGYALAADMDDAAVTRMISEIR